MFTDPGLRFPYSTREPGGKTMLNQLSSTGCFFLQRPMLHALGSPRRPHLHAKHMSVCGEPCESRPCWTRAASLRLYASLNFSGSAEAPVITRIEEKKSKGPKELNNALLLLAAFGSESRHATLHATCRMYTQSSKIGVRCNSFPASDTHDEAYQCDFAGNFRRRDDA